MKKYLLLTLALSGILTAGAAAPMLRSAKPEGAGLKEINRNHHAATPRADLAQVRRVATEAPANAVEVPFTHDLGKAGPEVKQYTHINANGDSRTWKYGAVNGYAACMTPNDAGIDTNDD